MAGRRHGYGSAANLAWLVKKRGIIPFIPVIDKSNRKDGTWPCADFEWDEANDHYVCPEGNALKQFRHNYSDQGRGTNSKGARRYQALKSDCQACPSKHRCCPKPDARSITREEEEDTRDFPRSSRKTKANKVSRDKRKKTIA